MKSKQQKQVKQVFEKHAGKWAKKAKIPKNSINVIKQRNDFVEKIALKFLKKKSCTLDVGCGTGNLVLNLQKKHFDAYGIDFAESMIKRSRLEAKKFKLQQDKFSVHSFFDYSTDIKFDLISANGFIEYISKKQLSEFIKKSYQILDKKGFLVFTSRNRLFNIFSNNNYTRSEIKNGTSQELIKECIIFNSSKNFMEIMRNRIKPNLKKNLKFHDRRGSDIFVDSRFQYTPMQIIDLLKKFKFESFMLSPIHIHVFPTNSKNYLPKMHDYVSNYIQNQKNIPLQFIPQASSFAIAAKKI